MSDEIIVVLTAKSVDRILREGGTSSWRLDRKHARQCSYALCTRNAHAEWVEGSEPHHSAFLIGRVRDVVPSPDHKGRYLVRFSEYAQVNIPEVWKGDRNPVKYTQISEFGIDPSRLGWTPMPEAVDQSEPRLNVGHAVGGTPLTMAEAKKGLALTFGVPPEAIEITIRG